jgi:DNA-directed RNA polymerase specialized sigma24 family protein
MSPSTAKPPPNSLEAKLDEVARLMALLLKRDRPLTEAIEEMSAVGFGQKRISELIGTSTGYVDNVVQKARKKPVAKKKPEAAKAKK